MPDAPALIPREVLFGNPERSSPRLSPDGKRMAYLAPDEGVLNVWVRTIGAEDDRVVTRDRKRGIRMFFWAENNRHLLYIQDTAGDENWHLYSVDLTSNEIRDLTPHENVTVQDVITDRKHPDEVLVAMNQRDPKLFDLHRIRIASGESALEAENPGAYVGWLTDHEFRVRGAQAASWKSRPWEAREMVAVALDRRASLTPKHELLARGLSSYYDGAADSAGSCHSSAFLSSQTLPMIVPRSNRGSNRTSTSANVVLEMTQASHRSLATAVFRYEPGVAPAPITS